MTAPYQCDRCGRVVWSTSAPYTWRCVCSGTLYPPSPGARDAIERLVRQRGLTPRAGLVVLPWRDERETVH